MAIDYMIVIYFCPLVLLNLISIMQTVRPLVFGPFIGSFLSLKAIDSRIAF